MSANFQSCIRKVCVLSVMALVSVSVLAARAAEFKTVKGNWDITNKTGTSANDFHMKVKHPGGGAVQIGNPNQFFNTTAFPQRSAQATSPGGPGTDLFLDLDWSQPGPGLVNPGQTVHIGYEYKSTNHNPQIVDAFWTASGARITSGEAPKLPGFKVGSLKLSNNTGEGMTIESLNFLISPVEVLLADMLPYTLAGFGTSSGLGTFVPTFTIPDGGEFDVTGFLPALPNDDEFLLWQLTSYPTASPTNTSTGMYQFEGSLDAVPEPGTLVTLGGLLAIGVFVRRKRHAHVTR